MSNATVCGNTAEENTALCLTKQANGNGADIKKENDLSLHR